MLKSKIKTHTLGRQYTQPHFFILNKGRHAGQPCRAHWSNCFVFLADDQDDADFHFYLFLGLWELGLFRQYLIGTVVQFIRLGDLVDVVEETVNAVTTGNRSFEAVQSALAQVEAGRERLHAQLTYLMQLRRALFYSYLRG